MKKGVCKLCLQNKLLCKRSHILPNFLYRELFDERHRIVKLKTHTLNLDSSIPTGEYDENILCEDCDNRVIGQHESYAREFLYGDRLSIKMENYRKPDGLEFIQVNGLDYVKFKLFLLSLLWRASISKRPFFDAVRLGPDEDKLRSMILCGEPGPATSFPCIITSYRKHKDIPSDLIVAPRKVILDQTTTYNFLANGLWYSYRATESESIDWVLEAALNEQGNMKIVHIPVNQAKEMLNNILGFNIFPVED